VDIGYQTVVHGVAFTYPHGERLDNAGNLKQVVIRVGDSPDIHENSICGGGAFDATAHSFKECNLIGRYVSYQQVGTDQSFYVCSLAITEGI